MIIWLLFFGVLFQLYVRVETGCTENLIPTWRVPLTSISDQLCVKGDVGVSEEYPQSLRLNPSPSGLFLYSSVLFVKQKFNVSEPWRFQFGFRVTQCGGHQYPVSFGDGFTVVIQNEVENCTDFRSEPGSGLGYHPPGDPSPNSIALAFDFHGHISFDRPLISLLSAKQQNALLNPIYPPWENITSTFCGRYNYLILNFDGSYLTLHLNDDIDPVFQYPIKMSDHIDGDQVNVGITMGTGSTYMDLVVSHAYLNLNCDNSPITTFKENCISQPYFMNESNGTFVITTNSSNVVTSNILLELFNNPLILSTGNKNSTSPYSTSGSIYKWIDLTLPWEISFLFKYTEYNTFLPLGCVGEGFAFVIQNEGPKFKFLNNAQLGYFGTNPYPSNSRAIVFDSYGGCSQTNEYFFITDATSQPLAPTNDFLWTFNSSKCEKEIPVKIVYDSETLFAYLDYPNMTLPWFSLSINFSKSLMLQDNKYGILEWVCRSGINSRFALALPKINFSGYSPSCITSPITQLTCLSDCSSVIINSTTIYFPNGIYDITTPPYENYNITFDIGATIIVHSNLTVQGSIITLKDNSDLNVNGDLNIMYSTIVLETDHPIKASGCIYANDSHIKVSIPEDSSSSQVILESPCIYGDPQIEFVGDNQQGCINGEKKATNAEVIINFTNSCDNNTQIYLIIGGCLLGLLVILLVFTAWYIRRKKLLYNLKMEKIVNERY